MVRFMSTQNQRSALGFNEDNKGEFQGIYSKIVDDCKSNSVIRFKIPTHRPYSYYKLTSPTKLRRWTPFENSENVKLVYAKFQVENDGPCHIDAIDAEVYVQPK